MMKNSVARTASVPTTTDQPDIGTLIERTTSAPGSIQKSPFVETTDFSSIKQRLEQLREEGVRETVVMRRLSVAKDDLASVRAACTTKMNSTSDFLKEQFRNLTSNQLDTEIAKKFHSWDANGDGNLSKKEFACAMAHMGKEFSDEEVAECFAQHDKNQDKRINMDEFNAWVREYLDLERPKPETPPTTFLPRVASLASNPGNSRRRSSVTKDTLAVDTGSDRRCSITSGRIGRLPSLPDESQDPSQAFRSAPPQTPGGPRVGLPTVGQASPWQETTTSKQGGRKFSMHSIVAKTVELIAASKGMVARISVSTRPKWLSRPSPSEIVVSSFAQPLARKRLSTPSGVGGTRRADQGQGGPSPKSRATGSPKQEPLAVQSATRRATPARNLETRTGGDRRSSRTTGSDVQVSATGRRASNSAESKSPKSPPVPEGQARGTGTRRGSTPGTRMSLKAQANPGISSAQKVSEMNLKSDANAENATLPSCFENVGTDQCPLAASCNSAEDGGC